MRAKVIELVPRLREAGISTILGVVDWDGHDHRTLPTGVRAIADGARYSLENIFLDPLLIAFVLARTEPGRTDLGVPSSRYLDGLDNDQLQTLINSIVAKIAACRPSGRVLAEDPMEAAYIGGRRLKLPAWVLLTRGHDYAEYVLAAFPYLRQFRAGPNNEPADQLVGGIAAHILVDAVDYVPDCVLSLFSALQAVQPI